MIFHKSVIDDIKKYYLGTIVKFPNTGDRLQQIVDVYKGELRCVDADGFELFLDLDEAYEVEYAMPSRTVYQMGKRAAMLYRKPAKQYYRGIHTENTVVVTLTSTGNWSTHNIFINLLQEFVDKPCYQDINLIDPRSFDSIALNKYVAVTTHGKVYIHTSHVGSVSFQEKTVTVFNSLFKPELTEAFSPWKVL